MANLLPTAQNEYMKKLVSGDVEDLFPPTEEEIKQWHTFYLCYFNNEFSLE